MAEADYTFWSIMVRINYLCTRCKKTYKSTFDTLAESIPDALESIDMDRTCLSCNPYDPIEITMISVEPAIDILRQC